MASKHPILQSGKLREGEKIVLLKVTPKLVVFGPKPKVWGVLPSLSWFPVAALELLVGTEPLED